MTKLSEVLRESLIIGEELEKEYIVTDNARVMLSKLIANTATVLSSLLLSSFINYSQKEEHAEYVNKMVRQSIYDIIEILAKQRCENCGKYENCDKKYCN